MDTGEDAALFAGFTSTTYSGAAGSREVMHARCAAAFAGSHLCHLTEYVLATPATIPPTTGAWADASSDLEGLTGDPSLATNIGSRSAGRYLGGGDYNCSRWTATVSGTTQLFGTVVTRAGSDRLACSTARPLACCSTPYREHFRGFTTQTVTGARAGGRNELHQMCGAQYPGSHLCFLAEYERATPASTPPAAGAWIDVNGYLRSQSSVVVDFTLAGRDTGRLAGASDWNCYSWTQTTSGSSTLYGAAMTPEGVVAKSCASTLPAACCD